MSKQKKNDSAGLSLSDFKYGIILAPISIILYMAINIAQIWYPSRELDILQTIIFFIVIFTSITIIIDYFLAQRKRK